MSQFPKTETVESHSEQGGSRGTTRTMITDKLLHKPFNTANITQDTQLKHSSSSFTVCFLHCTLSRDELVLSILSIWSNLHYSVMFQYIVSTCVPKGRR